MTRLSFLCVRIEASYTEIAKTCKKNKYLKFKKKTEQIWNKLSKVKNNQPTMDVVEVFYLERSPTFPQTQLLWEPL